MILRKKWECKKGHTNDPENSGDSLWKCSKCSVLRWAWWKVGGILTALIIILFLAGDIYHMFGSDPEEAFKKECRRFVIDVEGDEGEITERERVRMEKLSQRLEFSREKAEQLCLDVKKAILKEKENEYLSNQPGNNEITPDEHENLLALAERMEISYGEAEDAYKPEKNREIGDREELKKSLVQAKKFLKNGDFKKARNLLSRFPNNPKVISMLESITMPLSIDLSLQYQHPGEKPSAILSLNSEKLAGLVLTPRDNYRLFCTTNDKIYLYIFQAEKEGKITRLFPDPMNNLTENPILAGIRYQFPYKQKEWYYLEELPIAQESNEETIYFLASRWPAHDLNNAYGAVYKATTQKELGETLRHLLNRIAIRKDSNIEGVFFQKFTFSHRR